jgi:sulfite dehydrogenase (quinone) subunit SoeC
MHPAFSVIFFTTLSGAGYGLWFWLVASTPFFQGREPFDSMVYLVLFALGLVMVALGLCSSVLHLGKPMRSWRAFSQWRTSWLSREGVLAMLTFLPFVVFLAGRTGASNVVAFFPAALAWLALGSLATVACTGMIYASLRTIPAWSHRLVVPVYLVLALLTGGLIVLAGLDGRVLGPEATALSVIVAAMLAWRLKRRYWRDIDRGEMPATRASALGLPANRIATVFERPHTEANYLTREMGYVLARKHSARLRVIAVVLFAFVPMACVVPMFLLPGLPAGSLLATAAVSALLGTLVERWLFFAEAKHVVMLYY